MIELVIGVSIIVGMFVGMFFLLEHALGWSLSAGIMLFSFVVTGLIVLAQDLIARGLAG